MRYVAHWLATSGGAVPTSTEPLARWVWLVGWLVGCVRRTPVIPPLVGPGAAELVSGAANRAVALTSLPLHVGRSTCTARAGCLVCAAAVIRLRPLLLRHSIETG
eukprot:1181296-Prymnesium_polylepis.1